MSDDPDDDRSIACAVHGETQATFVCAHLAEVGSTGLGVHFDEESDEPWPDMFCSACNDEPPWTDERARELIRVLCVGCRDDTFGNNCKTRHPDPDAWLRDASERAQRRQRLWTSQNAIGEAKRYRYQLEETPPWLGFGPSEGKFTVLCEPTVIGSWSAQSGTWLWGWANDWWAQSLTRPVVRVKRAGERLGIERLWRSGFDADKSMAWEAAMAALDLLPDYSGIYRSPDDDGALFLAVRNTRRST